MIQSTAVRSLPSADRVGAGARTVPWSTGAAGAAAVAFAALHHLGRTWGATKAERSRPMPGDEVVDQPFGTTMHGITVDAPPEEVWRWIVQMGYHRAGWYTPRWVDRWVWRIDNPSADQVIEELQHVHVGDIVPDGEPGTAFYVVEKLDPPRELLLHSTSHVPRALSGRTAVDWTWSFVLEPRRAGAATRLLLRVRATGSPASFAAWHLLIVPSDFVMARSMLRGIKQRAERPRSTVWP
jgi:hypothetical protein